MDALTKEFQRAVEDALEIPLGAEVELEGVEISRDVLHGTSTLQARFIVNGGRVEISSVLRDDSVGYTPVWYEGQVKDLAEALLYFAVSA